MDFAHFISTTNKRDKYILYETSLTRLRALRLEGLGFMCFQFKSMVLDVYRHQKITRKKNSTTDRVIFSPGFL